MIDDPIILKIHYVSFIYNSNQNNSQMYKSKENKILQEELCRTKANDFLQQCVTTIQELEEQLERQVKVNQEQKQLIQIIQESKEYYENEYKNNSFEKEYSQLKGEFNRINALANAHRKANQQLKERVLELEEALMQKNKEVEVYAESIDKMRLEKEILEKEWNRVVKAVKKKITKIVDEKQEKYNPQANKQNTTLSMNLLENQENCQFEMKEKLKNNYSPDLKKRVDLIARAQSMVKRIEKEEAISEFESIFLNDPSSSIKKVKHSQKQNQMRRILREVDQNVISFDNVSF